MRDLLQFSHCIASKATFSYEFSLEPENLQPQNRCFVRGFRQFSAHRTKCHACHGICTLSPLDAALPMRFAINTQHDTSKVLRLHEKCHVEMTMECHVPRETKVLRLPRKPRAVATKNATHLLKTSQKYCACHTKRLSTRYENTVECHRSATPATQNEATRRWKPPKMTTSAELTIGTAIRSSRGRLRTVAERLTTNATSSEHTLNPQTPRVKREPLLRIREKCACPTSKKLDFADKIEKCMEMREAGRWWRKNHLNIFYLKKSACPISKKQPPVN